MPEIPQGARMTDEQLKELCHSEWEEPSKDTWKTALDVRDATSEHTWAYLEPVLRGLMEATARFIDGLHTKEMSIMPSNIVKLNDALAAAHRALEGE